MRSQKTSQNKRESASEAVPKAFSPGLLLPAAAFAVIAFAMIAAMRGAGRTSLRASLPIPNVPAAQPHPQGVSKTRALLDSLSLGQGERASDDGEQSAAMLSER